MAKVNGTFYTAERLRRGTTPVSPPYDGSEGQQPPVTPSVRVTPPVAIRYASEAEMIADQINQRSGYLYFDGTNTWWYKGIANGVIGDYQEFGGDSVDINAVHYNIADVKNATEKQQARDNIGSDAGIPQVVSTTGTINSLVRTSNIIVFTGGANVDLRGINTGIDGERCTILNLMGGSVTLYIRVVVTVGFQVSDSITLGHKQSANLRYSGVLSAWFLENSFKEGYNIVQPGGFSMPGNATLDTTSKFVLRATASTSRIFSMVWGNNSGVYGGIYGTGNIYIPRSVEAVDAVRRDESHIFHDTGSSATGIINDFSFIPKFGLARLTGADGLTGVTNGENGREIVILNDKGTTLTLYHEDAGSVAANRFNLGGVNIVIPAGQYKKLLYYGSRWRIQA